MTLQKDIFSETEGDAWFRRNSASLSSRDWSLDPVCVKLKTLVGSTESKILEIGCGDGSRLAHLTTMLPCEVYGIDPSEEAVAKAKEKGIKAIKSTADILPFDDGIFDVVIFGFCLYLCDDIDLFRIAQEADRVMKDGEGWLLILDFESRAPTYRLYHHLEGIQSRKMDYKSMFLWHPSYTLASLEKFHHETQKWTDDSDHWVSLACLRKYKAK